MKSVDSLYLAFLRLTSVLTIKATKEKAAAKESPKIKEKEEVVPETESNQDFDTYGVN